MSDEEPTEAELRELFESELRGIFEDFEPQTQELMAIFNRGAEAEEDGRKRDADQMMTYVLAYLETLSDHTKGAVLLDLLTLCGVQNEMLSATLDALGAAQ